MRDLDIKLLLSSLTGVAITRVAMPLLSGQLNLRNRKLIWHAFKPSTLPAHLPAKMKGEISKFFNDYASAYKQFVPEGQMNSFESMLFCWYAEDASITQDDINRIDQSNLPDKEQIKSVAQFIQDNGVPLAKSRAEWEENPSGKPSYNGSDVHREHFGWAWGATELPMEDDGRRRARPIPEAKLNDQTWLQSHVFDKKEILVSVATAEQDGAYGIFFTDGTDILPVIPEAMIKEMKQYMAGQDKPLTPDTPVMKHLLKSYGGFEKFFIFRSQHDPHGKGMEWAFTPGEKRFLLDKRKTADEREWDIKEDINDPHPKGVHWKDATSGIRPPKPANDGRHRGMYVSGGPYKKQQKIDPRIFVAMIRANGTMYWQNESDPSVQINMTEQQVDHFNGYKNKVFALANPGYRKWGFDISNPEQKAKYQKYLDDCVYLDKLRNFVVETTGKTHVASQKYQCIMVAPRFTFGKQVGETETAGFLYHSKTESPNTENVEEHPGLFTGKRDEWVIEKTEYDMSDARAEKFKYSKDIPQAVHGFGALSDHQNGMSAEDAVQKAVQLYRIPQSVIPNAAAIEAAQAAFDNAQNYYKSKNTPQSVPGAQVAPNQTVNNVPVNNTQSQSPVMQPQQLPKTPTVTQNNTIEEDQLAKSSKDILDKIKKLG